MSKFGGGSGSESKTRALPFTTTEEKSASMAGMETVVRRGPGRPKKVVAEPKKEDSEEDLETYRISIFTIDPINDAKVQIPVPESVKASTPAVPVKERYLRRRVTATEREFIWKSTQGYCYLCKTLLPKNSSWHIEHVIAFSKDPSRNDVLGNMLPSCATCNLRKNSRDLLTCIDKDLTFDLATFAKDVDHLHTDARNEILMCLDFKRQRLAKTTALQRAAVPGHSADSADLALVYNDEALIDAILKEIEGKVLNLSIAGALDSSGFSGQSFLQVARSKIVSAAKLDFAENDAPHIGCGGFGDIYVGKLKLSDTEEIACAIKMQSCLNHTSFKSFLREIEALTRLAHPHIVTSYGWFAHASNSHVHKSEELIQRLQEHGDEPIGELRLGLVLEYCAYNVSEHRVIQKIDLLALCSQICEALVYIHAQSFIHRDIKPNNILVVKQQGMVWKDVVFKLCDFGLAKYTAPLDNGHTLPLEEHTRNAGTASFRPPEVRKGELYFESDIYSLGKTVESILSQNDLILQDGLSYSHLQDLCKRMTLGNYSQRPTASQALQQVNLLKDVRAGTATEKEYKDLASRLLQEKLASKKKALSKDITGIPSPMKSSVISEDTEMEGKQLAESVAIAPQLQSSSQPVPTQDRDVYMNATACCKENPKGKKGMKFHLSLTCRYVVGKEHEVLRLDEQEAKAFLHSACLVCNKSGESSPSPKKNLTQDEILAKEVKKKLVL